MHARSPSPFVRSARAVLAASAIRDPSSSHPAVIKGPSRAVLAASATSPAPNTPSAATTLAPPSEPPPPTTPSLHTASPTPLVAPPPLMVDSPPSNPNLGSPSNPSASPTVLARRGAVTCAVGAAEAGAPLVGTGLPAPSPPRRAGARPPAGWRVPSPSSARLADPNPDPDPIPGRVPSPSSARRRRRQRVSGGAAAHSSGCERGAPSDGRNPAVA